ncbi:MAG: IspD/TarI family cytidylyltransferase [Acidimicrobiia bacterium]
MAGRAAIVVAAGASTRFNGDKMMIEVAGLPLVAHSVRSLQKHVGVCVLVCREDQQDRLSDLDLGAELVIGGATRTESELSGLAAVGGMPDVVGIHDGARPLVTSELIEELYQAAASTGGAVPVLDPELPLVKRTNLEPAGAMVVQTPQVFRTAPLLSSFVKAAKDGFNGHDTADVVSRYSKAEIAAVPGDPTNIKVTYPEDLERVRGLLEDRSRT